MVYGSCDLDYNYNITAELVGTVNTKDDKGKEVWNRKFNIYENEEKNKIQNNNFLIEKNVKIDYDYYNNLARSYENEYKITIDSVLKLRLNVFININDQKLNLENKEKYDYIELDIPITNTVTNVEENYEKSTTESIDEKNNTFIKEILFYLFGVIFILIAITLIVVKLKRTKKTPDEIYRHKINRILKYYRDIIVRIDDKPDLSSMKVMKLTYFEDLVDVAEQNQANIIFYEEIEKEESNFYVIINNYVFFYKINTTN